MVGFLRGLTRDWQLKTLAFALALLLWIGVSAEQVTTTWMYVPLEIRNSDPDYRLESADAPSLVEVRLSGRVRDLFDLRFFRKPSFILNLSGIQNPVETRFLDPRMLQIPPGMEVNPLDVRPASVRLEFTRVGVKRVPVRARLSGGPGPDWAVVDTLVGDPGFVDLAGPSELLAPVGEVFTLPIELTPADSVIDRTVAIDTTGLAGITLSATEVRLTGRMDRVVDRVIRDVPVTVPEGFRPVPDRVNVTLRGAQTTVGAVAPASLQVTAEIAPDAYVPPDGVQVPVRIDRLRSGMIGIISPSQVRLVADSDGDEPDAPADEVTSPEPAQRSIPE